MAEKRIPDVNGFEKVDLTGKKGVLLDLDDTLYPYRINHLRAHAACQNLAKTNYDVSETEFDDSYRLGRSEMHELLKHRASSHSRLLYFQRASEHLFSRTDVNFALEMETCYWSTFLDGMELYEEAEVFLDRCKDEGLKTCIVTDLTAQIQMQKWQKLKLDDRIDLLLSSEEAGIEKPNESIFQLALDKIGLSKDEVVMIGDNLEKDIKGAERFGIRAYHIEPIE